MKAAVSGKNLNSKTLLGRNDSVAPYMQLLVDVLAVSSLLYLLAMYKGIGELIIYHRAAFAASLLMWVIYINSGVYRRFTGHVNKLMSLTWAWMRVFAIMLFVGFVLKISDAYSREVILLWFVLGWAVQVGSHFIVHSLLRRRAASRQDYRPSLMIGAHHLGQHLARNINDDHWARHKIIGVVDDDEAALNQWGVDGVLKLNGFDNIGKYVGKYGIKRLYVALPMEFSHKIQEIQLEFLDKNVDVIWAPDIFGLNLINPSVREVAGVPLLSLSESPLVGSAAIMKTVLDYTLTSIALLLLSPVMITAAIAVKISSSGPVIFRQERHGLDGEVFEVYKFRSMVLHIEEDHSVTQTTRMDPRLTKVGAFLRKTSIDELPQLFNVLQGQMSLVGPRPHAVVHNHYYSDKINAYMARHRIKPGITGLAQVNGYRGETETLDKMEKRVEYDLAYINNWSIWLDIQIIVKTAFTLFSKNAY